MKWFRKLFFLLFYLGNPPWDTHQSPPELLDFIEKQPAGRALDLGCGTGTNAITLAKHGWQVLGIDFIAKPIRNARKKAKLAGVEAKFRVEDVTKLKGVHGPFDLVLDIGCFHSLRPSGMAAYQANLGRLLAPGGTYLLYVFFKPADSDSSSGLEEADLKPFTTQMELVDRQDGSERGLRRSAWLTYRKGIE